MFQALNFLHQISDGSLDNVSFPMENSDGIKEEPHEYDLPERDYDCSNFVETEMSSQDPDAKSGFYKFGSYKKIKKSKMKNDGSEGGAPGKPYECNICGKAYKGRSGLHYHIAFVHEGKKPFSCDHCQRTFTNKKIALVHECNKNPNSINPAALGEEVKKPFSCDHCSKAFISKSGLQYHYTIEHELEELGINEANLSEHMTNPRVLEVLKKRGKHPFKSAVDFVRKFKCELCDKSYDRNTTLFQHIESVHGGANIFKCGSCRMKFQSSDKLQKHSKLKHDSKLTSYNQQKKFKCDLCVKSYISERELNLHTAVVHEGKKPFACELCPMKYTAKDSLIYHITLQHELKDQGINETNFHEHMDNPKVAEVMRRKSNIPKKQNCKLCGKVLESKDDKSKHIREAHIDESGNFTCPQCDLTFRKYELGWLPFSLFMFYFIYNFVDYFDV